MSERKGWPLAVEERASGPTGDASLAERLRARDRSALDEIMALYWQPLVAYAERLVASRDAAEDIVQETMVRLWAAHADWTPADRLRGLVYRIARNLALNERRRVRVRERHDDAARALAGPPPRTPLEDTERAEIRSAVAQALDALPARRREVFILGWYHGHSYREIAEIMDISPQTVANQMSAALNDLRGQLRPRLDALLARGRIQLVRDDGPASAI